MQCKLFVRPLSAHVTLSAAAIVFCLTSWAQVSAEQTVGVFFNDGAYPGYNLYSPVRGTGTYLVDNDGNLIKKWIDPDGYSPGAVTRLTRRGTVLKSCFVDDVYQVVGPGAGRGGLIREYAWDTEEDGTARVIWQYRYNTANLLQHHDFRVLPNGNLLITAWEKSEEYPGNWEHLIEVKPNYGGWDDSPLPAHGVGGQIVWEWHLLDYLVPEGKDPKDYPHLWDPAAGAPRINAVDYDRRLKQLLMSAQDEIWIIKKRKNYEKVTGDICKSVFGRLGTTAIPSSDGLEFFEMFSQGWPINLDSWKEIQDAVRRNRGGLLYRWGNPSTYLGEDTEYAQTSFFQHGVRWVKKKSDFGYVLGGRNGAGNILFFNNRYPGGSRVQEFTPPLKRNKSYVQPEPGTPFGPAPGDLVRDYPVRTSPFLSNAQRLPNGNTLVNSGSTGTFVELAPDGTEVWKFVSPVVNTSPVAPGTKVLDDVVLAKEEPIPSVGIALANMTFQVKRYAPKFQGFRRKDLTPIGELIGTAAP